MATRQAISDVATRLFIERGFDRVTVDDIAEAADVGRVTVFNHFPRKEDLFFDRDREALELVRDAVDGRDPGVAPVEALRLLAHRLVGDNHRLLRFSDESRRFVDAVGASEVLKARARAIRDEGASLLAEAFARAIGRPAGDPQAHLGANLLLAAWSVAFVQAHDAYRRTGDGDAAKAVLLANVERGSAAVEVAMRDTPYARSE